MCRQVSKFVVARVLRHGNVELHVADLHSDVGLAFAYLPANGTTPKVCRVAADPSAIGSTRDQLAHGGSARSMPELDRRPKKTPAS
jgi:hypothetical protein